MRKVELIYLHALLATTYERLEERHDLDADTFEAYEDREVGPYQIQRRKAEHESAIRVLADGLAATADDLSRETEKREA